MLFLVGTASHLMAQGSASFADAVTGGKGVIIVPANGTGIVLANQNGTIVFEPANGSESGSILTVNPIRTYSGTAIRTAAGGQSTTGTFSLSFYKGGGLAASFVFNGVTTTYDGSLSTTGGLKGLRTGFIYTFPAQADSTGGSDLTPATLPLLVDKTAAYGGVQNADGTALTFRADRQTQ